MSWLEEGFVAPDRLDLSTGHHLRPLREADVDLDYPAVMGSRDRLWARYGDAWGWPPATMTHEQDRVDLVRHEREIAAQEAFAYAIVDDAERELVGCMYIDPPKDGVAGDAVVSWWVVDAHAGGPLEAALDATLPQWLTTTWGFSNFVVDPPPPTAVPSVAAATSSAPATSVGSGARTRRRWWQRRWLWVATGVVVVLVGFVLYWFQPQKLFIDERVDEAAPTGNVVDVASGEFVSLEHATSGVARVLELEDGRRIVRLEALDTSNGPTLRVYLTSNRADGEESAFDDTYVDLGGLKGNLGSQNYDIPADTDIAALGTVVIWCDRFDAAFGAADLTPGT